MKFPNLFPKVDLPRKYEPRTNMAEMGVYFICLALYAALIALPVNLALWGVVWIGDNLLRGFTDTTYRDLYPFSFAVICLILLCIFTDGIIRFELKNLLDKIEMEKRE